MLKLSGNTKLQVWFVSGLTAFFIVICLIFHVGIVDAKEIDEEHVHDNDSTSELTRDLGQTVSIADQFGNGSSLDYLYNFADSGIPLLTSPDTYCSGYYLFDSSSDNNYSSVLGNIQQKQLLKTFTISGHQYSLDDFPNFVIFKRDNDYYMVITTGIFYYYYRVGENGSYSPGWNTLYCSEPYVYFKLNSDSYSYYDTRSNVDFYAYTIDVTEGDDIVVNNPRSDLVYVYSHAYILLSNCSIYSMYWEDTGVTDHNGGYECTSFDYDISYEPFGGSSSQSTENDLNNLFLNNAHWSFNIPKGNDSRGFPKSFLDNGKAVFSGLLNTYQSNHLDNFYFHYTFYIQPQYQQGTGSGDSGGGGHPISILDAFRQNEINNNTTFFPPVFQFNLDGQTYYNQTMREFNTAGQSCTFFTTDYLFDNCYYQGDSFNDYIESWHFSNMTNCYLYCTAVMFSTGGGVSGTCQAWYDLCTGQSGVTSENMTINPDPYNPDSITPPSTTTTSGQFGNIIINNNNTLNGGSGLPIGSTATQQEQASFFKLFNPVKFFLGLLTGSNSSTGEELRQSLGVNNWLTIITTTFSFIPPSFINALSVFFVTSLGILIVGLIFRVILDLL